MTTKSSYGRKSRREFLKGAAVSAGAAFAVPTIITSKAWGAPDRGAANGRINVGVIGCGGRGQHDVRGFLAQPDTQVVAVCDCWKGMRDATKKIIDDHYGNQDCASYIDFRELLAREDIDAVLIATGDNNHSMVAIESARAGKDMYCEKPLSVCITESRAVADTMQRLGRVFQCGTQRRSLGNFRFAAELALSGKLGQLKELHAEQYPGDQTLYDTVLPAEELPPVEEFDWDLWLGPALWRPYNSQYRTRPFWMDHVDFSGGAITEWGSHTVDLCQWANGTDDTSPIEYWQEGDRFCARYANGVKLVIRSGLRFGTCPVRYEGTEGWVETGDSGQIDAHPKSLLATRLFEGGYPMDNHVRVFLDCVHTRQQPNAPAETAHNSITACHVANICKRLGRPIKWDPVNEVCIDDEEANRLTSRAYREPYYL
jgi:predicted dehydrogenase